MVIRVRPMLRHLTPGNLVWITGLDTRPSAIRNWIHPGNPMYDQLGIVLRYPADPNCHIWGMARVMCLGLVVDLFHDCVQPLDGLRSSQSARGPPNV